MSGRKHAGIPRWQMRLRSLVSRAVDSARSLTSRTRPNKPYKLPDDPIFARLLQSPHHQGQRSDIIIRDVHGFEKSYGHLLSDILRTAERLRKGLPPAAFCKRGLLGQDLPYVGVLVNSGYEFIVVFFAIRSLGGACMPLSPSVLPEEAHYFISKSKAICLLAGNGCHDTAAAACAFTNSNGGPHLSWHPISNDAQPKSRINLEVDPALPLDPRSPGLLIFTSGTTGLPKGVILPRSLFSVTLIPGAAAARPVSLVYRSPHWIAGTSSLVNSVLAGSTLHVLDFDASAADVLDAAVRCRPTRMVFTPTLLRQMREVILSRRHGEGDALEQYAVGFRGLGGLTSTSAPLEPSLRDWWAGVAGAAGKNMYGATELGGVIAVAAGGNDGWIGKPVPGTEIKLSGSPSGEILIKSASMFIGYLGDEESTKAAFTDAGFWKTGDTAEVKDGKIFFTGRASADYIYFRFYRILSLVVETGILALPYVTDACVLGVPYRDTKQLCGAVIKIRTDGAEAKVDLARIRADLAGSVAKYMLPVVLRVLGEDEQIPRTYSGKPIKKRILSEFLGTADWFPAEEVPEGVEYCGCGDPAAADSGTRKAWDFGGVR